MKKFSLIVLLFLLVWCSSNSEKKLSLGFDKSLDRKISSSLKCITVWQNTEQILDLKAKVVSSNVKNIVSNNAWIITYLNCNEGQKVNAKTLIAKISPDWSDPNVKNLISQKNSLNNQILNINNIIASTKNNFSSQLNSLIIQKASLETQIKTLQDSLTKLEKQKKYWLSDLKTQISTLQTQLKDLEKSKEKLEQSKQAELKKLNSNIANSTQQGESLIKNILIKIDEIYGITDENYHKNDAFEIYLSAKNTALKEKIKGDYRKLVWWLLDEKNIVQYLQKTDDLANLVKESIKASVTSITLPQNMIDSWYWMFDKYDSSLINLKNSLETLYNTKETLKNNYDNQILNLQTQINTIKNNIENLKNNKLSSYSSSIDIQINQTKSQLDSLKSNLEKIVDNIKSLKEQENIQIKQFENQISQLNANLANIQHNLSNQNIYAKVDGKVKFKKVSKWNKIGPGTLLCQIIPKKSSLKLQIYGWDNLIASKVEVFSWCELSIISKLPYKNPITQNSIYETENLPSDCNLEENKILNVKVKINWKKNTNNIIKIPLDFVINKITGQKVKIYSWNKLIEKNIKLWNVDWVNVEVLSGLKIGDRVCR